MLNIIKKVLLVASMVTMFSISSYASEPSNIQTISQEQAKQGTWEKVNNNSWKYSLNGVYLTSSWVESQEIKGVWYFLNSDGLMLKSSYTPDGYYVDSNGVYTSNSSNTSNSTTTTTKEIKEVDVKNETSNTNTQTINEGLSLIQDYINKGGKINMGNAKFE